jgi:hypothetical protein
MYVAARIPPAGLVSHRAGAVHLTEPEAAPAAGADDCSGWTSLGAAAQAKKIARVERETIEMQLKSRALFKFVLLLLIFRLLGRSAMLTQVPASCTIPKIAGYAGALACFASASSFLQGQAGEGA